MLQFGGHIYYFTGRVLVFNITNNVWTVDSSVNLQASLAAMVAVIGSATTRNIIPAPLKVHLFICFLSH